MQSELRLHRFVLAMLVIWFAAFIAVLLYLDTYFASEGLLEAIASLVTVIVVATAFLTIGMAEEIVAFRFGPRHKRELVSYLLLGGLSIASGLYLALSDSASLQTIAVVVAPHAFLFGMAELRIAQHLHHHPRQRKHLILGGLLELTMGVALVGGWRLSSQHAAMLLGYVAILSSVQLLPFLLYKRNRESLQAKTS